MTTERVSDYTRSVSLLPKGVETGRAFEALHFAGSDVMERKPMPARIGAARRQWR